MIQRIRKLTLALGPLALMTLAASAGADLHRGDNLGPVTIDEAVANVNPGSIVIVSEEHGFAPHHENQFQTLEALARRGLSVSVGMEFFEVPHQSTVNAYLRGQLADDVFLKSIGWGTTPFSLYRRQVLFPVEHGGWTWALNAPRTLTRKISQRGLSSLSEEEKNQLPPEFSLGSAAYLERFTEVMKDHVPAEAIARYFEAQSTWDEFMSHTACEAIRSQPQQVMMIIVGDFHAMYGGGLPDRLRARGCTNLVVISQVNRRGKSEADLTKEVSPHPRYGQRGDFVWIEGN